MKLSQMRDYGMFVDDLQDVLDTQCNIKDTDIL